MSKMIAVEVCYATPTQQRLVSVQVPENTCVSEAIESSGLLKEFPELEGQTLKVGIFSQKCPLNTVLKEGDRIEIYRPLTIDPKTARRLRAQRQRKKN